jgi:ABC-type transport system involved in multi-copper enzyme maturation permease subunit
MRNFLAVMKDSFREAVDGFVIYVMLGMALITIVAVALISFEPNPADKAFPSLVGNFQQVFRNRGADVEEVGSKLKVGPVVAFTPIALNYSTTDIQKLDGSGGYAGKYKMKLTVTPPTAAGGRQGGPPRMFGNFQDDATLFPTVVYAWSQEKTPEQIVLMKDPTNGTGEALPPGTLPKFEMVPDGADAEELLAKKTAEGGRWMMVAVPKVSAREAEGVTDEMMSDFIRNQFLIHGDIDGVTVTRKPGVAKPNYEFEVEAEVKAGSKGWPHAIKYFFGQLTFTESKAFGPAVYLVQDILVNTIGASVTLLVAVVLTGFFIPNMLRKGSLDLLVAKTLARWQILLYKYIGGLLFMLMVSGLSVGGVWLVMAVRTGNWNPTFLLSIPILTFAFGILYALSTLTAVLTRSAIAAIVVTALFLVFMWGSATVKLFADGWRMLVAKEEDKQGLAYKIIDGTYYSLPRYNDMLKLNGQMMMESYCPQSVAKMGRRGDQPSWGPAAGISLAYVVGFLSLAYARFATRDP